VGICRRRKRIARQAAAGAGMASKWSEDLWNWTIPQREKKLGLNCMAGNAIQGDESSSCHNRKQTEQCRI
jgi:hypothetical protein